MGRRPCCDKVGLKRGPWTVDEDHKLINFILTNGIHCWRTVPKLAGLLRCGKSCRLRWINYLRPDLKRGDFSEAEEDQIIQLHSRLGNRWSKIAANFPGRTDNEIKNHWNTKIKKRLKQTGSDPIQEIQKTDDKNLVSNKEPDFSEKVESEPKMDQTSDLFENNYDLLWGSFESITTDKEVNDKNNSNTCTSSYTSSISVEESANASDQTQSSLQLQQWVESVDSILSWDFFDQIDEDWFSWNTQ